MSVKCTKNRKTCVVPQYHKSAAHARKQVKKWLKDYRSSWSKDFGDYVVTKIKLSKTGPYGGPNIKKYNRRLYNIHIRKK